MDELLELYETMGISPAVYAYGERTLEKLKDRFAAIDQVAEHNQAKVLWAMQKNRVSAACFAATTGYGYDDFGRDNLERVYADVFHTEAALVRPQITCGTHALALALAANPVAACSAWAGAGAWLQLRQSAVRSFWCGAHRGAAPLQSFLPRSACSPAVKSAAFCY